MKLEILTSIKIITSALFRMEEEQGWEYQRAEIFSNLTSSGVHLKHYELELLAGYIANVMHKLEVSIPRHFLKRRLKPVDPALARAIEQEVVKNLKNNKLINDVGVQVAQNLKNMPSTLENDDTFVDISPIGKELVEFESLSDSEIELLLIPINQLTLGTRLSGLLRNRNVLYLGQLVDLNTLQLYREPNVGRKTIDELFSLVQKYNLKDFPLFIWPEDTVIRGIIASRKIEPSRSFKISCNEAQTLEEEVECIIRKIVPRNVSSVLIHRLGTKRQGCPMTLEEVAKSKIVNDTKLTRERIRQIEFQGKKLIKSKIIELSKYQLVLAELTKHPVISEYDAEQILKNKQITNLDNPLLLISNLERLDLVQFPFIQKKILWINQTYLVNKNLFDAKILTKFFKHLQKEISGNAFAIIDMNVYFLDDKYSAETIRSVIETTDQLICIPYGEKLYIAKRPGRLKSHANKLVTSLVKIFLLSRKCTMRDVYKAVKKTRNLSQEFPFPVFERYLQELKFFKCDEMIIECLEPPETEILNRAEGLLVKWAKQFGDRVDSTTLHNFLVCSGMTSQAARQIVIHSPLIITIKKGRSNVQGLYAFVGDLKGPLFYMKPMGKDIEHDSIEITIPINASTRIFGKHTLDKKIVADGIYEVFDKHDNFICKLISKGNCLNGLKPLTKEINEGNLIVVFDLQEKSVSILE